MSIKYSRIAWEIPLRHNQKIVLLALSDFANDEGVCWPSLETLSKRCGLVKSSLMKHLKLLETQGFVSRKKRNKTSGFSDSNLYHLNKLQMTKYQRSYNQLTNNESWNYKNQGLNDDIKVDRHSDTNHHKQSKEPSLICQRVKRSDNDVSCVFNHWCTIMAHPKAKLDNKRQRLIVSALQNYSLEQIKQAIDGCARSGFHMGDNAQKKRYDELSLILRDAEHIEKFIALASPENGLVASDYLPPDLTLLQGVL